MEEVFPPDLWRVNAPLAAPIRRIPDSFGKAPRGCGEGEQKDIFTNDWRICRIWSVDWVCEGEKHRNGECARWRRCFNVDLFLVQTIPHWP
jgi:hypothetical protein